MPLGALVKLQRAKLNYAILLGMIGDMDALINGKAGDLAVLVVAVRAERTNTVGTKGHALRVFFVNFQQIELLLLKKEHIDNLIDFARRIKTIGVNKMDFTVFDTKKVEAYAKQAKEQWGQTDEYREYEEKVSSMTDTQQKDINNRFMLLFAEFGTMKELDVASEPVQAQVKKLQEFITNHFYTCTKEILSGLGKMYAAGGEFTENIDSCGGEGTAQFTADAIELYCTGRTA